MASRKRNAVKHPQTAKKKSITEVLAEKRKVLSRLVEEYEEVVGKDAVVMHPKNEIKMHNAELRRLFAEINVTKSLEPEIMPNDPDFLFESAKKYLEKEAVDVSNSLAEQDEAIKQLYDQIESLKILEPEGSSSEEDISDTEILEDEKVKLELMQTLHRKLASRLKNLARSKFISCSEGETSENTTYASSFETNPRKNLYRTLKAFFVELQIRTNIDVFGKIEVEIDDSCPREYLQLLLDCDIIEIISKKPLILSLKEP